MTGGFTGDSAPGTEPHQERPIPTSPYETPDGKTIAVLKDDYGFRTGASRLYDEHYGEVPANIFSLVRCLLAAAYEPQRTHAAVNAVSTCIFRQHALRGLLSGAQQC